jgi:hypothetical protein
MKTGAVTLRTRSYQKPKQKRKSSYENRNSQFKPTAGLLIPLLLACFAAVFASAAAPAIAGDTVPFKGIVSGAIISSVPLTSATRFLKSSTGVMRRSWHRRLEKAVKIARPLYASHRLRRCSDRRSLALRRRALLLAKPPCSICALGSAAQTHRDRRAGFGRALRAFGFIGRNQDPHETARITLLVISASLESSRYRRRRNAAADLPAPGDSRRRCWKREADHQKCSAHRPALPGHREC